MLVSACCMNLARTGARSSVLIPDLYAAGDLQFVWSMVNLLGLGLRPCNWVTLLHNGRRSIPG